ncbi:hypothetical protein PENCOP_c005G00664 [Penicillium coprophilum]|uniref:Uncharacterized protein n=1 Tax=Penicillium coprophilum TaxID=36646 RepID=A0A1V6UT37_9EURO|nr:hypothetical protein PENCOP_c005G00664 [Penicillium coprophilum]
MPEIDLAHHYLITQLESAYLCANLVDSTDEFMTRNRPGVDLLTASKTMKIASAHSCQLALDNHVRGVDEPGIGRCSMTNEGSPTKQQGPLLPCYATGSTIPNHLAFHQKRWALKFALTSGDFGSKNGVTLGGDYAGVDRRVEVDIGIPSPKPSPWLVPEPIAMAALLNEKILAVTRCSSGS